jgi:hypothetical protein
MRRHRQILGILALNIAMLLPLDDRSNCCSTVVVAIVGEEAVVVIIIFCCAALVEECKVEESLLDRNARFPWKLTRHSALKL